MTCEEPIATHTEGPIEDPRYPCGVACRSSLYNAIDFPTRRQRQARTPIIRAASAASAHPCGVSVYELRIERLEHHVSWKTGRPTRTTYARTYLGMQHA